MRERFPDLHPAFDARQATVEANRCLNCFDAPCMGACPTHIDVPRFIKKIASGNIAGSARSILEANVLGASCSRVCPVQVLCEGSCVMHQRGEKPIEIGRLQRLAMETYYSDGGWIPLRNRPEREEKIACIGAGPASLACAAELRQHGFQVTVFDRRPLPGGLNSYGVAEYKLRTQDSLREIARISRLGVEFAQQDIDASALNRLEGEYHALFLGVGLGQMHRLELHGADKTARIVDALEFIAGYKSGQPVHPGARVVVVGAGNTAIDAAIAAKHLGAERVTMIYRRSQKQMSAFSFEYDHALRDGVGFIWEAAPISLEETADGLAITCVRMQMTEGGHLLPDDSLRFLLECDMLIPAIGQSPLLELLSRLRDVRMERGRVVIDRATGQTSHPRYFAGGDCVNGGREVVDAVADGKRAALGIAAWIGSGRGRLKRAVEVKRG